MTFFSSKTAVTKLQVVLVVFIVAVVVIFTSYSTRLLTPTPSSSPTPSPTLNPLPFFAYDFYPEPNSTNILTNTNISITFSRPPQIVQLHLYPPPNGWTCQFMEIVGVASGKFTFHFSEPLKPETTYTVNVIYGQEIPPEGHRPLSSDTWNFTTAR